MGVRSAGRHRPGARQPGPSWIWTLAASRLRVAVLAWLPRRSRRKISAGPQGLTYLTVHKRRPGLALDPAGRMTSKDPERVIAGMVTRHGGHVVNVSATLAEVANSGTPAVLAALTKGGLAAATRSLAVEYASRGIRVNAVSPGIIQTPTHPPESYEDLGDRLPPLGRAGQVSDVVDAVLFLESSPYITGEILHIDGGQTAGH